MKGLKTYCFTLFLLAIMTFIYSSCSSSLNSDQQGTSLKLLISESGVQDRTIAPGIDMDIKSYRITGEGPDSASFSDDIAVTAGTFVVNDLEPGNWAITVAAYNGNLSRGTVSGDQIGTGSNTTVIYGGKTSTCNITVMPLTGNGTFVLSAQWTTDVDLISTNPVSISLVKSGSTTPIALNNLTIDTDARTISCTSTTLEYGYYTLNITVRYNDNKTRGLTEIVRIVAGQQTSANLTITTDSTGDLEIVIIPDMNNPISPVITFNSDNTVATVTATGSTGSLVYTCYIDGVQLDQQTSSTGSVTFNLSSVSSGSHRIDVTVFTTDYSQGGSASEEFQK